MQECSSFKKLHTAVYVWTQEAEGREVEMWMEMLMRSMAEKVLHARLRILNPFGELCMENNGRILNGRVA